MDVETEDLGGEKIGVKGISVKGGKRMCGRWKGSLTVEAAIVVPIVLICILWMVEKGIALYSETTALVQDQGIWEEFYPAKEFRRLEWVEEALVH